MLVVEVADTSLALDRLRKGGLYARAGMADYWVVNLIDEVLEVYREPVRAPSCRSGWKYDSVRPSSGRCVCTSIGFILIGTTPSNHVLRKHYYLASP